MNIQNYLDNFNRENKSYNLGGMKYFIQNYNGFEK